MSLKILQSLADVASRTEEVKKLISQMPPGQGLWGKKGGKWEQIAISLDLAFACYVFATVDVAEGQSSAEVTTISDIVECACEYAAGGQEWEFILGKELVRSFDEIEFFEEQPEDDESDGSSEEQ